MSEESPTVAPVVESESNWTKLRRTVGAMPPLSHWPGKESGTPFSHEKSEVMKWLMKHLGADQISQIVFSTLTGRGYHFLEFDPETRLWHGVSAERKAERKAERQAKAAERAAAAAAARAARVKTGKVWHRPGHPPGRRPSVAWPTMIVDKLEAFVDEHNYQPSTGELRDFITASRTCSPATYFRALSKARADAQVVETIEIRDGVRVKILRRADAAASEKPAPAQLQFAQADENEPL